MIMSVVRVGWLPLGRWFALVGTHVTLGVSLWEKRQFGSEPSDSLCGLLFSEELWADLLICFLHKGALW